MTTSLYGNACKRGFSLVEILVVVSIIGVLMTVVSFSVNGAIRRARISRAQAEVREMANSFKAFYTAYDDWPIGNPEDAAPGDNYKPVTRTLIEALNEKHLLLEVPPNRFVGGNYVDPWGKAYEISFDYVIDVRKNTFTVTLALPMFERRTPK